jgi:hypothetical protein
LLGIFGYVFSISNLDTSAHLYLTEGRNYYLTGGRNVKTALFLGQTASTSNKHTSNSHRRSK